MLAGVSSRTKCQNHTWWHCTRWKRQNTEVEFCLWELRSGTGRQPGVQQTLLVGSRVIPVAEQCGTPDRRLPEMRHGHAPPCFSCLLFSGGALHFPRDPQVSREPGVTIRNTECPWLYALQSEGAVQLSSVYPCIEDIVLYYRRSAGMWFNLPFSSTEDIIDFQFHIFLS